MNIRKNFALGRFIKISSYFFSLILLALMSTNVFAQAQKKTDGIYGPMNYGLDREDAWEANQIRYRYEIDRSLREREAQIIAIGKQMKNCRTSECRAPLHKKIDEVERKNRFELAAIAKENQRRIDLINKYWDIEERKPQKKRIYFP